MPYIWAQALSCSGHGHPLVRPLFLEFPHDPGSWLSEDQYLFGSDLLVAPLFEQAPERDVYLPPCQWVDLQTKEHFEGGRSVRMRPKDIPALVLARAGAAIATTAVAQHTGAQDFGKITLLVVGDEKRHEGLYAAKDATSPRRVVVEDGVAAQLPDVEFTLERI
jgi:alpha-D-xyloside xylohydrolase